MCRNFCGLPIDAIHPAPCIFMDFSTGPFAERMVHIAQAFWHILHHSKHSQKIK